MTREVHTQVVIVGGGLGGCAAALALAERNVKSIMIEPTKWIGGQLTSQGVPADENRWVETVGATARYQGLRNAIRRHYREHESLTDEAKAEEHLNPGGGWVSRICCSPRIAHDVLRATLRKHVESGVLTILDQYEINAAENSDDLVQSVTARDTRTGEALQIVGDLFLEASETGDLLELAGIEHRIGAEGRAEYGEMHAPEEASRDCQQPPSWCFAIVNRPGDDSGLIEKPEGYAFLRNWIPPMTDRPWPGPLFSWVIPTHSVEGSRTLDLAPWPDTDEDNWELWRYRRIVDASKHTDGRTDVCFVNWVQMDDWRRPLLQVPRDERAQAYAEARGLSRAFLYWMQNEAPRRDGGTGFRFLHLCGDELGTIDGFAMSPYIREPRRLEAVRMLHEDDIGSMQRGHEDAGKESVPPEGRAKTFEDSIAIGHYHIDLHPTPTGRNSVYVEAAPFQIPLRSLLPVRVRNVIGAGKCIGVTHIANGATRTHAVEWGIGEAAGMAAAHCIINKILPESFREAGAHAESVRASMHDVGAPTEWPWDVS